MPCHQQYLLFVFPFAPRFCQTRSRSASIWHSAPHQPHFIVINIILCMPYFFLWAIGLFFLRGWLTAERLRRFPFRVQSRCSNKSGLKRGVRGTVTADWIFDINLFLCRFVCGWSVAMTGWVMWDHHQRGAGIQFHVLCIQASDKHHHSSVTTELLFGVSVSDALIDFRWFQSVPLPLLVPPRHTILTVAASCIRNERASSFGWVNGWTTMLFAS